MDVWMITVKLFVVIFLVFVVVSAHVVLKSFKVSYVHSCFEGFEPVFISFWMFCVSSFFCVSLWSSQLSLYPCILNVFIILHLCSKLTFQWQSHFRQRFKYKRPLFSDPSQVTWSNISSLLQGLSDPVAAVTLRDPMCQAQSNGSHFLLMFPVISCGTEGLLIGQPRGVQYKNMVRQEIWREKEI